MSVADSVSSCSAGDTTLQGWLRAVSLLGFKKYSVLHFVILRKIYGQTEVARGIWRIKTNKELDELIKHRNTINYVKAQRLSRFGHTNRMAETGTVKRIHKWKTFTGRPAGRPKC